MIDPRQIPTDELKDKLRKMRIARSYACSTEGQILIERIENELQRRQPHNLGKSAAQKNRDPQPGTSPMLPMTPAKLKRARKSLGLSQQELGDAIGLTRVMVGMMERGEKAIEPRTAMSVECLQRREGMI